MGKYDPLTAYLTRRRHVEVELSFRDIERLVGGILPKAARNPDWWTADAAPHAAPQKRALAAAGFVAEVSIKEERVRFAPARVLVST